MAKKKKNKKGYMPAELFMIAAGSLMLLYIYLIICIYPFVFKQGYGETSYVKYGFLITVSYGFKAGKLWIPTILPVTLFCALAGGMLYLKGSGMRIKDFASSLRFSLTDICVALYGLSVIISAIVSPYKHDMLWGLDQSHMGLASQFLFILIYFMVSRLFDPAELKGIIYASLISSAGVFIIGILQRFGLDVLDLYHGIDNRLFISTIGQHTFFSSYMIPFFMLGVFSFWITERGSALHRAAAVYLIIASCLPCILNADMIYFGIFFGLSFLFILSFESTDRMLSFLECALIILLSFRILGIVWRLLDPEFRLEPLSKFILWSPILWIPAAVLAAVYIFLRRKAAERAGFEIHRYVYIGYVYAGLVGFMMLALTVYIILNTAHILPDSLCSKENYLLFDAFWGNGRGAIWHDSVMSFIGEVKKAPLTALFGAGPDQFFFVLQEYVHDWLVIYTDKIALYAHNEWLNAFICYGLFGGLAYPAIFVSSLVRSVKNRAGSAAALGAALITAAYLAHQLFCYQQYISTPYLFLAMGIGERALRERKPD